MTASAPKTSWLIGEEAAAKKPPLPKWGSASIHKPVRDAIARAEAEGAE